MGRLWAGDARAAAERDTQVGVAMDAGDDRIGTLLTVYGDRLLHHPHCTKLELERRRACATLPGGTKLAAAAAEAAEGAAAADDEDQ